MGQLSEPSNSAAAQAGIAEREAAETALQSQDNGAAGSRSDTSASQVAAREVSFNPADEPASSSGVASGAASAGAQPAGAASGVQSEYEGALDYARRRGLDVSRFGDDGALMDALVERYHRGGQEDYYAQLGRQLAPQAPAIQQYLAQQKQQAQQPASPPEWEAPPFDERWAGMVDRDAATGIYLGKPGTPAHIVDSVNKYADYQKKYASNPLAAVRPYVEQTLPDMISKLVEDRLGAYQRDQAVQAIVQQNSTWMFEAENGRMKIGVGGRPIPTAQGMRYSQHVQFLEGQGLKDPNVVDQLARQLLMGEVNGAQLQQHQAGTPAAAQQRQALASGRPQANVLQSLAPAQRAATPGSTEPNLNGLSLHEQLRAGLDDAGFTDADFQDLDQMR